MVAKFNINVKVLTTLVSIKLNDCSTMALKLV